MYLYNSYTKDCHNTGQLLQARLSSLPKGVVQETHFWVFKQNFSRQLKAGGL